MKKHKLHGGESDDKNRTIDFAIKNIFGDRPHIEVEGNTVATIEGSRGVIEYSDQIIRVNMSEFTASFCGKRMRLKYISESSLVIEGFFEKIEFIR